MLKKICLLTVSSLYFAGSLFSQSKPAATSRPFPLFVGGEYSTFNPDWGCLSASAFTCWNRHLSGVGVVVNANHVIGKLSGEAEMRWLNWGGPGSGLKQSNYLLGPRYPLLRSREVSIYGKGLFGESWMFIPLGYGSRHYFTIAPGATVEIKATKRLILRADYEYQVWPTFSGISTLPNHRLTPNGLSFGATYRVW